MERLGSKIGGASLCVGGDHQWHHYGPEIFKFVKIGGLIQ